MIGHAAATLWEAAYLFRSIVDQSASVAAATGAGDLAIPKNARFTSEHFVIVRP
jgi:hypothetical protein